jgi:hypothetical protein
LSLGFGI